MAQVIDRYRVRELMAAGAQLVEVLPGAEYDEEHIEGAVSLPLKELNEETAAAKLDRSRPVITYCWDYL